MLQNFANLYKPSRNAGQFLHFHPGKSPGRGIMPCAIGQLEQQGGADMVKNDSRNFFFHGLTAGPARAAQSLCLSKLRGAVAFASFTAAHVVGSRAHPAPALICPAAGGLSAFSAARRLPLPLICLNRWCSDFCNPALHSIFVPLSA